MRFVHKRIADAVIGRRPAHNNLDRKCPLDRDGVARKAMRVRLITTLAAEGKPITMVGLWRLAGAGGARPELFTRALDDLVQDGTIETRRGRRHFDGPALTWYSLAASGGPW